MSNRTRAWRRHHRNRMLNRALRISWFPKDYATKNFNHLAKCSCSNCGNQRRNLWEPTKIRLTMQERKVYNILSDELEDYYSEL